MRSRGCARRLGISPRRLGHLHYFKDVILTTRCRTAPPLPILRQVVHRCTTTTSTSSSRSSSKTDESIPQANGSDRPLKIIEVRASASTLHGDHPVPTTLYTIDAASKSWNKRRQKQRSSAVSPPDATTSDIQSSISSIFQLSSAWLHRMISHFVPAQYPHSVASGYAHFCQWAFVASIAGSAAMVLSTQTLLLAVGVVGHNASNMVLTDSADGAAAVVNTGIMAGALNWVLKDGVGQLGGVLYASQQSKSFDAHPKQTRMLAALALDAASLLEILSPSLPMATVLPVACVANVLKNIGYLTASASRAALHQSLSKGNLADVTAKSGSQSMAAGLLGTAVGIGLSSTQLVQSPYEFVLAWCALSGIHQVCNYYSLKSIVLSHFNRSRLDTLLHAYVQSHGKVILSPEEMGQHERYYPVKFPTSTLSSSSSAKWLVLGSRLDRACPTASDLVHFLDACHGESYLLTIVPTTPYDDENVAFTIHLTWFPNSNGDDVIRGMFHAHLLHQQLELLPAPSRNSSSDVLSNIRYTHQQVQQLFPKLLQSLHTLGWTTATERTMVEPSHARRIHVMPSDHEDKK